MSMHKSPKISITVAAAVLTVVALAACTTTDAPAPTSAPATAKAASSGAAVFPTREVSSLVEDMPQRTVKDLPAARLADGLIPPTNRWFSGLVFGEESMPVFPLPLSFQLTDSGFAFGLPEVSADTNVIRGGFTGQIGQSFDLVDWGSSSGSFSSIDATGLSLASGAVLDTSHLYTAGVLRVTAVPEPGTWALLLCNIGVLLLRLRARRLAP